MIKTFVQSLKCGNCNVVIGEEAEVIKSKVMPGTYLTFCPHCNSELLTAGENLIKIPNSHNNELIFEVRKELAKGLGDLAIKKIDEAELDDKAKQILKDLLNGLENELIKSENFKNDKEIDKRNQK